MTLRQAADGLGRPVADLIGLIDAPDGVVLTGDVAFKDLETLVPGFELTEFRELLETGTIAAATPEPAPSPTEPVAPPAVASPTPAPSTPDPTASPQPEPLSTGAPGGITGAMTLREVADANGLAAADLVAAAGLPADVALDTTLRELRETVPGFELQSVRDAVASLD